MSVETAPERANPVVHHETPPRAATPAVTQPELESPPLDLAQSEAPPVARSQLESLPVAREQDAPQSRRSRLTLRRLILPGALVILLVAAFVGWSAYRQGQLYVSTDNAQLTGTPIQVGSMNAGRVDALMPTVGSTVHKGDTLAQVALPTNIGTAQNGQPELDFLASGNSTVDVQAPVDGVVLAVPTTPGATVQAGQPLVTMVDPTQLWVNANIEETSIDRLKVGQPVTVHVDALGADVPGRVEAITPATANTFSLLPSANSSGNFTKVTQLVPVRIALNLGSQPGLLGSSVEVKIRAA